MSNLQIRYAVTPHLNSRGRYLQGSHTEIHGTSDRLGIHLTQQGQLLARSKGGRSSLESSGSGVGSLVS